MASLTTNQIKLFELFDMLHNSRLEDFKTFNKRSYRGVWSSIIDKYPESAHFVYELLQNADDAEATEVHIILRHDQMLFKHNGKKHFNITLEDADPVGDINSITGIGDSSKINTQNKIGKFGVGFKAVFQYTDTPEIYDDVFKFKIENYIVPTLLTHDHPERQEGETLFVFPLKNSEQSYQDILRRLENLQNPILFLHNIRRIVWRINRKENGIGKETEYSKKIIDSEDYDDNITMEHYVLHEPSKTSNVFLFSEKIIITNDGKSTEHLINVGYYYDSEKKKLITNVTQNIYCFFPTKESFKTCFVSHAPFLLTDNRQNLKPNENINKELINLLAELAAKAVVHLRDYGIKHKQFLIDENITEIIPNYVRNYWQSLDERFEEPIADAFKELLDTERILLSRNGKYLSIKEAYKGSPKELVELLSQEQLATLTSDADKGGDYDADDEMLNPKNVDFLKWELAQNIIKQDNDIYGELGEYTSENFARDITPDFMKAQDLKWVTKMYTFLRTAAPKLWKLTDKDNDKSTSSLPFREAPIIKTQKGEWVKPFVDVISPNVYLPLKDDNKSDYNFVANEYLQNEMAKKFFMELDLKEPDEYDYIRQVILGKFESDEIDIEDDELSSDFMVILRYYQKIKDKPLGQEFVQKVKEKIYLVGKDGMLYRPHELYFYSHDLELYLSALDDIYYIDLDFYKDAIAEFGEETVRTFISRLEVRSYPEIESLERWNLWYFSDRLQKQISTTDIQEFHFKDFVLKGFNEFTSQKVRKETSLYLWNVMLPALKFGNYEHMTMIYRRKYARSYDTAYYDSTFKDSLQYSRWIFDKNGNVLSSVEIVLEDLDAEYDRNNGLIQFLGIEKREKSILELGGTEEQQEQLDLGKRVKQLAGDDLTEEEIIQVIANAKAQKKARKHIDDETENTFHSENVSDEINYSNIDRKPRELKNNNIDTESNDSSDIKEYYEDDNLNLDSPFNREELRETELSDMFVNNYHEPPVKKEKEVTDEVLADELKQKFLEQEEKHNKVVELREAASNAERYSKEWFDALIELEYRGGTEETKGDFGKSINITFGSVNKEQGSERIYVLKNPSRCIPLWLEEIGDIEVKFTFSNRDELKLKFEVANVRENSLRLKVNKAFEEILSKITWNKCTKATITLKNQIDLMGKLRIAFNDLDLEDGFNLKENLDNNLKFIFGPPGTGKTTTLAKKIIGMMKEYQTCRILVLAPTNTACDELAKKIKECSKEDCAWLYRFVSSADESLEDIVVDRESMVYEDEQCCIISTMARLPFDGFNGEGGYNKLLDIVWDMIVCDEASMIPLAEMVLAIYNFVNTPILIAGDPLQIKPILHEEEWKDENIYTMVNLDRFENPVTEPIQFSIENLNMQYRSLPAIGELYSQYAYDGKLRHYRSTYKSPIKFGELNLKAINFIPFKVEKYDSVFGIKKLDGSNVHIYSVLFTLEIFKYIVREYAKNHEEEYSIGIVCPYSPQAQLIESLIMQTPNMPANVKVTVGTVHRFQGGQCNFMFVVLNPPIGMKVASDRIFLNNKNILNVAISRAQDFLCILLPHRDTDGYENLYEINKIGRIAMKDSANVAHYTCDQIEEIIFGCKFFIENNTFVTSHQLTNVYTKAVKRYEVRIDENSVDIQLGTNNRATLNNDSHKLKKEQNESVQY